MKYQIEKATNKIVSIFEDWQDVENWQIDKNKYEIKQSGITFGIGELFEETDEKLKKTIRSKRNTLLDLTDKYLVPDRPINEEHKQEILVYRQALRDLPATISLENQSFPIKPDFIKQ